jgi:hypothetical protein
MTAVIKAVCFANGLPCPHEGQWLKSFNHDAFGGRGHGDFTDDVLEAMHFVSKSDAYLFWGRQSTVMPLRPDGKPNRPMTALTVEIEELV